MFNNLVKMLELIAIKIKKNYLKCTTFSIMSHLIYFTDFLFFIFFFLMTQMS